MVERCDVELELVCDLGVKDQHARSVLHVNHPLTRTRSSRSTGRSESTSPIILAEEHLTSLVTVIRDLFEHQKAPNGFQGARGPLRVRATHPPEPPIADSQGIPALSENPIHQNQPFGNIHLARSLSFVLHCTPNGKTKLCPSYSRTSADSHRRPA